LGKRRLKRLFHTDTGRALVNDVLGDEGGGGGKFWVKKGRQSERRLKQDVEFEGVANIQKKTMAGKVSKVQQRAKKVS